MNLEKDALEFLAKQAVAASTAVIHPPGEPAHVYYMREADGTLEPYEAIVGPRNYRALSLKDLAILLDEVTSHRVQDDQLPVSIAFVGGDGVSVVLDERCERRERLSLRLNLTKAFATLMKPLEDLAQDELITLLRVTLCGCVDKAIIQLFRSLKNTKSADGESTVSTSSKAISKAVKMEASAGGAEIPDAIVVNVPIYEEFACGDGCKRYPIECAVVLDFDDFTFSLLPMAGQINQAYLAEQQRIAEELRFLVEKNNCTVVCGIP